VIDHVARRSDAYADSVALMLLSRDVSDRPGVVTVSVVHATPLNLELLSELGFDLADVADGGPNDLIVAVRAHGHDALEAALALIDQRLVAPPAAAERRERRAALSITAAVRARPELNLAFISVPSDNALHECARALDEGLNVLCFSDGPTSEEEAELKRRAAGRDLLFMGPDCGTAIIDGVGLGFANAVRRGPVGVVGASGTGTQALTCLLDMAGVGISHAIGVGGRDLSPPVGGLMTLHAIERLAADPATEALVVLSKAPDPGVAAEVAAAARRAGKPIVLAFPGLDRSAVDFEFTGQLDEAARRAAALVGATLPDAEPPEPPPTPGLIRGLFAGGTLRDEAMGLVAAAAGPVGTTPDAPVHSFVDFGDDSYTRGRPHPMIDPSLRDRELERQADDPAVGVIVVDVVLGYGAHPDPVAELGPRIERALGRRPGGLSVIASVCGTEGDPQGLRRQVDGLRAAGAFVSTRNAQAARLALRAAAAGAPAP
jgi:FdrA protein